MFDHAGLHEVLIFASGVMDEYVIRDLLAGGAPIDGSGIGTALTTSPHPTTCGMWRLLGGTTGRSLRR